MKWVRPVVVLALTGSVSAGFFLGLVPGEAFIAFATGLVVYWFKARDESKDNEGKGKC